MLSVATFNVNSVRVREAIVLDWLQTHQPDLLALQETKVDDALFPVERFRELGYHAAFRGQKGYNGVALLSRTAPLQVSAGFDDGGPADPARLLRADFDGFTVVNTYVPQGRDVQHAMYAYKLEWFERLRAWFDRHFTPDTPLLWLGDMNVAHDPIDVFNPEQRANHVCYHADARAAFAACRGWGFEDTFRRHHPEGGHYTFFDYRHLDRIAQKQGWRLDYILATRPLAERCTSSEIDLAPRLRERPSDHTVLSASFDPGKGAPAQR